MAVTPARPVLVIVPCYNEQDTIGTVLAEVAAALPDADLLVVDDGSTDRTRPAALAARANVLTLPFNLGVGGALRTGFRYAVRNGYQCALQIDGDGQHDPAQAPRLLAGLAKVDLMIGARFAGGSADYQVGHARALTMRMLSRELSRRTHTTLTDTTSGYRAFGPRALALFATDYPQEYLGDTVEALLIASRRGLRIGQIPVTMRPRQGGEPSQSTLRSVLQLMRLVPAFTAPSRIRHQLPAIEEHP